MYAAVHGDLVLLQRYRETGIDLGVADYDGRTALNLACCSDQPSIARFCWVIAYPYMQDLFSDENELIFHCGHQKIVQIASLLLTHLR